MKYPTFLIANILLICIGLIYLYTRNYHEYYENPPLKIYLHGFWPNVHSSTKDFFAKICKAAFNNECIYGDENNSDIIIQSVFTEDRDILNKFKYRIFYTGENHKSENPNLYDVCLAGEHTEGKYISVPLFLLYLQQSDIEALNTIHTKKRNDVPEKDVLVIISNPGGGVRNKFLDELEKHFTITYAGRYKNNIGGPLEYKQNSPEFKNYIRQFKFIISMENSEAPHYLTEKILQGFSSQIVPVYWGASAASEYFNKERFIQLENGEDDTIQYVIGRMKELIENPGKWLETVNKHVFARGKLDYGPEEIGIAMRPFLGKK